MSAPASTTRTSASTFQSSGRKYLLGKKLGSGAFGEVVLCYTGNEQVAVKKISVTAGSRENIMREISLLVGLAHRNVLKVMDYLVDPREERVYIVTEFFEGGSLLNAIRTYGTHNESSCANIIAQVLEGLSYLHFNGVVHRDIKAANLLVSKAGIVAIGDFGLAKEISTSLSEQSIVGTPHWLAPEAIEESRWHLNSDIWSLGCTVVELITGRPPNGAAHLYTAMYRACQQPFDIELPQHLSAHARDLLMAHCFVKDPSKRATAEALLCHPWIVDRLRSERTSLYNRDDAVGMRDIDVAKNQLLCPVLNRPLYDAVAMVPCSHTVSEEAYFRRRSNGSLDRCLLCNCEVDTTSPNVLIRKLAMQLQ